ncbi:MAG TPA: hypothetical protein GXZ47_03465 [Treponema sp.]|nr:hypothetical protein [Treponema sp.]
MKYTVHTLELHRPITTTETGESSDGTIAIWEYNSLVQKNDLEPQLDAHLAQGVPAQSIEPGYYLFVQGLMPESGLEETMWKNAAQALWLEALWRGSSFKNDKIRVRILSEDSKRVFQLFREIKTMDQIS